MKDYSLKINGHNYNVQIDDVNETSTVAHVVVNGVEYDAWVYPYYTAYLQDDKVKTWKQTQTVYDGAIEKALESYDKACEIDPKSASKVKDGLQQISDF